MKRILLFFVCLLLLVLAGCTTVNQTNRFVALQPTTAPEATQPPVVTATPEPSPPVVELILQPTAAPSATDMPVVTNEPVTTNTIAPTATPVPSQTPEGSPGGFNG